MTSTSFLSFSRYRGVHGYPLFGAFGMILTAKTVPKQKGTSWRRSLNDAIVTHFLVDTFLDGAIATRSDNLTEDVSVFDIAGIAEDIFDIFKVQWLFRWLLENFVVAGRWRIVCLATDTQPRPSLHDGRLPWSKRRRRPRGRRKSNGGKGH